LQPDPSDIDGVHTYAYAGDDPSGLDFWSDTFDCTHQYDPFLPGKLYCVGVHEYRDYQTVRDPHTPRWEMALIVASYTPVEGVAGRGQREGEITGRAVGVALRRGPLSND